MRPVPARALALTAAFLLAACSSPSAATQAPAGTSAPPAATSAPPAATGAGNPVAGEPCSFLTGAQVTEIVGTAPVEIAERAGRGDCDYWLDAAKTAKVNVGVFTGADGAALFESTKALGETLPVPNLGDDAYMLVLDGLGTIVVARKGDSVVSVQLLNTMDSAEQAIRVINVARAVVQGL
jgi:hypothetical protein